MVRFKWQFRCRCMCLLTLGKTPLSIIRCQAFYAVESRYVKTCSVSISILICSTLRLRRGVQTVFTRKTKPVVPCCMAYTSYKQPQSEASGRCLKYFVMSALQLVFYTIGCVLFTMCHSRVLSLLSCQLRASVNSHQY